MFDLVKHQKKCKNFLSKLSLIQQQMLNRELDESSIKLNQFYNESGNYFEEITEQLKNVKKGDSLFLLKKQTQLSQRNIIILKDENDYLLDINDETIILYFEKQLKFKKIVKRQISK